MKPSFREIADRQLAGITFTDEMQFGVILKARRRKTARRIGFTAAACACAALAGAFVLFGRMPSPDGILPSPGPALNRFSSQNAEIIVKSCELDGYYLSIDYAVASRSENSIQMVTGPFIAADDAFIETENGTPVDPDTQRTLNLAPGETVNLSASLRIDDCRPGKTAEIRLNSDIYVSGSAESEQLNALITTEIPSELRKGAYVRSGESVSNSLFSVQIRKGSFTPEETRLIIGITSQRALLRKAEHEFSIRFTNESGELTVEYPLSAYLIDAPDNSTGEALYSFSTVLNFAPAEIRIICNWADEGNHGSTDAAFVRSVN